MYERLCNIGLKLSPLRLKSKNPELEKATRFLQPMMKITPDGVLAAGQITLILSIIITSSLLYLANINPILIILLTAMFCALSYYAVVSYPISVMNGYKLSLSEEADLVFEQFLLVFQYGGTIFDAIEMIAQSKHPYLSLVFQDMLVKINNGIPPETCLMEFAKNQPSDDLRRYFTGIISALEQKTEILELLSGESFEADLVLRQKNLELESRLLIVAALATYVPIMFTLAISLSGYATNPLIILLAPLFIILNTLFSTRFARRFSAYFDKPLNTGPTMPSQKEIVREYDEFLNFMILLGERLRLGDTLEVALSEIRDDVGSEVQRLIDPSLRAIYSGTSGLDDAMTLASESAVGQRVSNMLRMISLMCQASASDAGERISKIAARLIKRSAVAKERDSIIAAQKLKVYILTFTSAVVLGLLASLAPFLYIGSILATGPTWTPDNISILDILPLILTLEIITLFSGYMNTKMVNGGRPLFIGIMCGLTFLISFQLADLMMGLT